MNLAFHPEKRMMFLNMYARLFRLIAIVVIALASGYYVPRLWDRYVHDCAKPAYTLLGIHNRCVGTSVETYEDYEYFQTALESWIDLQHADGSITFAAVYFRDLTSRAWFGIHEHETFTPASLFKVPVMIAYLKAAEQIPDIFTEQVTMTGAYTGLTNVEESAQTIEPGKYYSIDDLLFRMIAYSDNASMYVLRKHLDTIDPTGTAVREVYSKIGMLQTYEKQTLTVKAYANLFRLLYLGHYLSPEMSQKALDLLTKSVYRDALVAGVPPSTVVAHKFGIRDVPGESEKQFHDCGIVYVPGRPYILCVMTRGTSMPKNIQFIRSVSEKVHAEVTGHLSGHE